TKLAFIVDKMCDYTGHKLGICLIYKESGDLTFNIGVVRYTKGENLYLTLDIRFPITYTGRQITNLLKQKLPRSVRFVESHIKEPLFVPENSELVQKLLSVYNSETKENAKAIAIGGGTYSRALPNCVAFGPLFPGEEQTIHMPNEYISLEQLYTMARMYMLAIKELSQ
ncbi:MAG: M20/M25/M40 family metallo-hydrolase, partial [Clostridia bacterium]